LDKDKFFDSKISLFLTLRSVYNYNNSFGIEKENIYNVNTTNDFLCLNNDDIGQIFSLFQENLSTNDEETNPDRIHFIPSLNKNTTNLNMNKEINIKSLDTDKSKSNELLEIKKELPPKFFPETSINVIIKNYYVNKELKLNLLLDINIKNNNKDQIKRVLESNTKKRRKARKKRLYRTAHIFRELINIVNTSLFNFINNLIVTLFTKEKIYQILDGIKLLNEIKDKDMKEIIKKIDYKIIGRLESKEKKLNLLNSTLKNHFSAKISSTYTKYPSNYNELIIDKILNDEDNKNIFDFIFNDLLIKDWIEIFLYKKDFKDFDKYILIDKSQQKIIKENLERVDKYINKIYKKHKNDKIYFHCFFIIAYNLCRFVLLKEKRNKNKNEEKM
jgi:hypothetical protein